MTKTKLEIQRQLRIGTPLADIVSKLGLETDERDDLVLLRYSQVDSPKADPIVMECRGLILQKGTWDIVSMPFRRFFNYGEVLELNKDFPYAGAVAQEKLDGTLIQVFPWQDRFRISTRGKIDASGTVSFSAMTFAELFDLTIAAYPNFWKALDKRFTYTFELISLENRIVTVYKERELCLTLMRDRLENHDELPSDQLDAHAKALGVRRPKETRFADSEELLALSTHMSSPLDEGYVCVNYNARTPDGDFPRIKVKNPGYVAIAHLKESSSSSNAGLMYLVLKGEQEEFLSYFPEYKDKVVPLVEGFAKLEAELDAALGQLASLLAGPKTPENRKAFAMEAKKARDPSYLFAVYDGKSAGYRQSLVAQAALKGSKSVSKRVLQNLGVKDVERACEE